MARILTLGGVPGCDVVFPFSCVGGVLALLRMDASAGHWIRATSLEVELQVDGRRVRQAQVQLGSRISIDGHVNTLSQLLSMARGVPIRYNLDLIAGRSGDAQIQLADSAVSRQHAQLVIRDSALNIMDLGSANGVRVNGRLVKAVPVSLGDQIAFGSLDVSDAIWRAIAQALLRVGAQSPRDASSARIDGPPRAARSAPRKRSMQWRRSALPLVLVLASFALIVIAGGVGFYAYQNQLIDVERTWHCKHCRQIFDRRTEQVPRNQVGEVSIIDTEYCQPCGQEPVQIRVSQVCLNCNKAYRADYVSSLRREEAEDRREAAGFCGTACQIAYEGKGALDRMGLEHIGKLLP
jgi:hypothetical protein